jgi:ABC-2 type transport system ATP-binding protein
MVIEASNVTVTYRDGYTAVDDVDLHIERGSFFGFLGPNGAGKTTFVKTLATLLTPTKGSIRIDGYDTEKDKWNVRRSIGYMPQETSIDPELTARENLSFACDAYNVDPGRREKRIQELLDLVQLEDVADKRSETYSGGMQKRLDAATALVHEPRLVFLDEPTTGLDPAARNKLWDYFRAINKRGTTFFLTTQYLEEADKLCDEIAVMQNGKIRVRDTPANLKKRVGGDIICVVLDDTSRGYSVLQNVFGDSVTRTEGEVRITTQKPTEQVVKALTVLKEEAVSVIDLKVQQPTLDDVFLSLTQ